jgi:hypothetical protein
MLAALALMMPLSLLTSSAIGSAAAVPPPAGDGLSGTWQVSRVCLTICISPRPVLKVVRRFQGAVFMTGGPAPQVLYLLKTQVLVHGSKDSLVLTIGSRGLLMSGPGVGADGSTFETAWRCVAPAGSAAIAPGLPLGHVTFTNPAREPLGMGLC